MEWRIGLLCGIVVIVFGFPNLVSSEDEILSDPKELDMEMQNDPP